MSSFAVAILSNTILASVLALLALAVARWLRQPRIAHALWLLVLVKLITPPAINLPVPQFGVLAASPVVAETSSDGNTMVSDPSIVGAPDSTEPVAMTTAALMAELVETDSGRSQAASAGTHVTPTSSAAATVRWPQLLLGIWIAGALALACCAFRRHRRFLATVQRSEPAEAELLDDAGVVSKQLGLTTCPSVRMSREAIGPVVITSWRETLVLLPRHLVREFTREQTRSVLAHEFAHIRRRDHLVRYFELLVIAVHWWNPIAWFAGRGLRRATEECCDAVVVEAFPDQRRSYGEALLRTVEFLTESRSIAPPLSGTAFGTTMFHSRIERIMKRNAQPQVPWIVACLVLALGFLLLPLGVHAIPDDRADKVPTPAPDELGATLAREDTPFTDSQLSKFPDLNRVVAVLGNRPFLHHHEVRNVQFSKDGNRLLTTSRHGLRVWGAEQRNLLRQIPWEGPNEVFLAANQAMDRIALVGDFGEVGVFKWPDGELVTKGRRRLSGKVSSVAMSPDGKLLAICRRVRSDDPGAVRGRLIIWSIDEDRTSDELSLPASYAMAWSTDGETLAVGLRTGRVRFLSPEGKSVGDDIDLGLPEPIMGLDFNDTGQRLAVTTMQGSAGVWKLSGQQRERLWLRKGEGTGQRLIEGPLGGIVFDDTRSRVYFRRFRTGILTCDADTGEEIDRMEDTKETRFVSNLALRSDDRRIAIGDGSYAVKVYDTKKLESALPSPNNGYSHAQLLVPRPGAPELVTVSGSRIDVWNLNLRRVVQTLSRSSYISAATFDGGGERLALAYHQDDATGRPAGVDIVDARTLQTLKTLEMDSYAARGVAFSADGSELVAAGIRGVYFWNIKTGTRKWKQEIGAKGDWLEETAISPDGKVIAVVQKLRDAIVRRPQSHSSRAKIVLLKTGTGEIVRTLEGPGTPGRLAFSEDGSRLYAKTSRTSSGQEGETIPAINCWDVATGKRLDELKFEMKVEEVSSAGSIDTKLGRSWVASMPDSKSVYLTLFDSKDGRRVRRFELPGAFRDLCQLSDGKHLVAAGRNGSLYLINTVEEAGEPK